MRLTKCPRCGTDVEMRRGKYEYHQRPEHRPNVARVRCFASGLRPSQLAAVTS